jgi:NADH-quinone oxidoreductase subunit N
MVYTLDLKSSAFKRKCSNHLHRISFLLVSLFVWINTLSSVNIIAFIVAVILLTSLCFGVLFSSSERLGQPNALNALLIFSLFLTLLLIYLFGCDFTDISNGSYFFSQHFQLIFLWLISLVILATRDFISVRKIAKFEYDILMLFVFLSSVCLCFCDDFLLLYLAIELQSLCFYTFATFNRTSEFSTESGLKYFIFGAIISCLLLLGFSFIYLSFGSTSFEFLTCLSQETGDSFLFLGYLFVLIALLFKVGSAPFHSWLCDVYDGAITSVTLLFASAPKVIIFSIIFKLFLVVFNDFKEIWSSIFFFASVLSIVIGSISAIFQKRLKRLFAYSTISHTGFILLGIAAASVNSASSLIFYIVIYAFLTILMFSLLIFSILTQTNFPAYLANWTSLGLRNFVFVISFTFVLFAIAGIPPLSGFFSKFLILLSVIIEEYYVTSLLIVIISSIASFYYIRLIKAFFFVKSSKNNIWISTKKRQGSEFSIGLLLYLNLTFAIFPELLLNISTSLSLIML